MVLAPANDSKAHIIPSALGGRLKSLGILSNAANIELNDKFDNPLVKAFHPLMSLIGGSRDFGENQPVRMTDNSNQQYDLLWNSPPTPARPVF